MKSRLLLITALCLLAQTRAASCDDSLPAEIDLRIRQKLEAQKIQPAPAADDAVLLRRLTLDLVGRIPTVAETQAYLKSSAPDKRRQAVERLMQSPGFVRHQAREFNTLLMSGVNGDLNDYLRKAFTENRPWDRMFREMLLGEKDDPKQEGAIRFVRSRASDLDKLTNQTSAIFFGINISCARCHDHPLVDDWKQAHFFGMKSFFNRTFDNGGLIGEREYGLVSYKTTEGESKQAQLMFLNGQVLAEPEVKEPDNEAKKAQKKQLDELKKKKQAPPKPSFSRREQLVQAALQAEQKKQTPYLARALANHLWRRFLGYALVEPVDQLHPENEPSHPQLLTLLAEDVIDHRYDIRRLIRGIVLSDTYARSSRWESDQPRPEPYYFAAANVRPLSPHQYAMALKIASYNPDQFPADLKPEEFEKRIESLENSARGFASQLEQPGEDFQVSATEALLFSNGKRFEDDFLRESPSSLLGKLMKTENPAELVEIAFWTIYNRPPRSEESVVVEQYLHRREGRKADACRQLMWALLASGECRFNY